MACNCLLEVASASSGESASCCRAESGEIEALLSALQSPSNIVREAGLKVVQINNFTSHEYENKWKLCECVYFFRVSLQCTDRFLVLKKI